MDRPRLAKLTRPRADRLVVRERLFRAIDDATVRPILWVSGPPGSGKTSLISSYIETRGKECLWLQLDEGDADYATFFYHLEIGVAGLTGTPHRSLRGTAADPPVDVTIWARRFFRKLFGGLDEGTVLVLDNYQELPDSSPLHAALALAWEEIPVGTHVMVLSQVGPSQPYSRLVANGRVSQLDGDQLRLTIEEARSIARTTVEIPAEGLAQLHEQAGGWTAGWVLLLETVRRSGQAPLHWRGESMRSVFDYFAGRIFERLDAGRQVMLLKMSYLPRLTQRMAIALTHEEAAASLLDELSQRNLFVNSRTGASTSYEFHSLFRTFLKARAERQYDADRRLRLAYDAARVIEGEGIFDEAVLLFIEAHAWDEATAILLREAETLERHGRRRTLRTWIAALPPEQVEGNPWLRYWLAVGELTQDHRLARDHFEQAWRGFQRAHDRRGEMLAVAFIAESFFDERTSLSSLHEWLERLRGLLSQHPFDLNNSTDVRALASLARVLLFRMPEDERLPELFAQLEHAVQAPIPAGVALRALNVVLAYRVWRGEAIECETLQLRGRLLVTDEDVSAADRIWFYYWLSFYQLYSRQLEDAATSIEAGRLATSEGGAVPTVLDFDRLDAWCHLARGDIARVKRLLAERVKPTLPKARLGVVMHYYEHLAECATADGDLVLARQHIDCGMRASKQAGHSWVTTNLRGVAACIYIDLGLEGDVQTMLGEMRELATRAGNARLLGEYWLIRAYGAWRRGDRAAAINDTRTALEQLTSSRVGYLWPTTWVLPGLPELWALALDHQIHVDYVAHSIRTLGLAPPDQMRVHWPWPIRVTVLGEFAVEVERKPILAGHKPQQKPLELFRMLLAAGSERLSTSRLADMLWPDSAGDVGLKALETTLHRLRKLLVIEGAVVLNGSTLWLDRDLCWCDAWCFDAMMDALDELGNQGIEWQSLAERAIRLYRGHLLGAGIDTEWAQLPREALRRRWVSLVTELGRAYESAEDFVAAERLYSDVLVVDPTTEVFYRSLISLYTRSGERSRVVEIYRICCRQLDHHLGVTPSQEIEALVRSASAFS